MFLSACSARDHELENVSGSFVETVESGAAHNAAFLLKRLILIE